MKIDIDCDKIDLDKTNKPDGEVKKILTRYKKISENIHDNIAEMLVSVQPMTISSNPETKFNKFTLPKVKKNYPKI